jgi:acyl-coenzyme A thioesterase PaaI-like protein
MTELSIQESLYPHLTCFGCGHSNPDGFHLRSYRRGDLTVATFTSQPFHGNGFGFMNGGIITTILDCHTAAVVMWEAKQRGWVNKHGVPLAFVTAGFEVRFLRPSPLAEPVELVAEPESIDEERAVIRAELRADDKVRATMLATWMRFRPRS